MSKINKSKRKKNVYVYDRRHGSKPEIQFNLLNILTFNDFKKELEKTFQIKENETVFICTTNREEINKSNYDLLENKDSIYLLSQSDQDLTAPTEQLVNYVPHYDTLVKSGMYEYYASEGKNPLAYAFAELIDNSLAATVNNVGKRKIELRLMLDDSSEKSCIFVIDNGCGMTTNQLNNWAIYRLSKFIRKEKSMTKSKTNGFTSPSSKSATPKSLNSDISFFGVGGKQAIFFIGQATRMITRPVNQKDVHELVISKDDFEKKERDKESIYSGRIINRQPGDFSHVSSEDEGLIKFIKEEVNNKSFTCVMIWGINPSLLGYLKHNYHFLCTQLAHTYHYYLHGPNGNSENNKPTQLYKNIDIEVNMYFKGSNPKCCNLRSISNDLQTRYIRTASNTFEFHSKVDGTKIVEGILRYHPYLYDHETYPVENEEVNESEDGIESRPNRGRKPVFECFWNGRLIPYTIMEEFEWCSSSKKNKIIPVECYNRLSGVLWANDEFQVSTNKLTFIDLENRLREKETMFTRVINGQEKRASIDKQFIDWLQQCHQQCDKQVMFNGFQKLIHRKDLPQYLQYPWALYNSIKWGGKTFSIGQKVRTTKTNPIIIGTIKRFLLFGYHQGDVCATGGEMEIQQEPTYIYDEVKVFSLSKLDLQASTTDIKKFLETEESKLPEKLVVTWPEGNSVSDGDEIAPDQMIGAINVQIVDCRDETLNKLPGQKKLLVELTVTQHHNKGDKVIAQFVSPHAKNWAYWFRKMTNIKDPGRYSIVLQAKINDNSKIASGKDLPSHKIKYVVTEGDASKFKLVESERPNKIGTPFSLELTFEDSFGNQTTPKNFKKNPILTSPNLNFVYSTTQIKNKHFYINDIEVKGTVNIIGEKLPLKIEIPELKESSLNTHIWLMPGEPHSISIQKLDEPLTLNNGSTAQFEITVHDISGNQSSGPNFIVNCEFSKDISPKCSLNMSHINCLILTTKPIHINKLKKPLTVQANFSVLNYDAIKPIAFSFDILPNTAPSVIKLIYKDEQMNKIDIIENSKLEWLAGEKLTGLEFTIENETGQSLTLPDDIGSKLKINWSKAIPARLKKGLLPDIEIPIAIKQNHNYKVTYTKTTPPLDFNFSIQPTSGDPVQIRASCKGNRKARLGETLKSEILVKVLDKHGNTCSNLKSKDLKELKLQNDDIDVKCLKKSLEGDSVLVIKDIKFLKASLGAQELCISYKDLKDYLRIEIVAGIPSKLVYTGYEGCELITIFNNKQLIKPFIVQLTDYEGNFTAENNIKIQLILDQNMKSNVSNLALAADGTGMVNFGALKLNLGNDIELVKCPLDICQYKCKGLFTFGAKALVNRDTIHGELLNVHIICDPNKPAEIKYISELENSYEAGSSIKEILVNVEAEDGSVYHTSECDNLIMRIWLNNAFKTKTERPADEIQEPSTFSFKNIKLPILAGQYFCQFEANFDGYFIISELATFEISATSPTNLEPSIPIAIPTVSNTDKLEERTLLNSLNLVLKDKYGNVASNKLSGTLNLQIVSDAKQPVNQTPRFSGNAQTKSIKIKMSQANLNDIAVAKNTPGKNGFQYILRCTATLDNNSFKIHPLDIPFVFFNDAQKQAEAEIISKERETLMAAVKEYKEYFKDHESKQNELKNNLDVTEREASTFRSQLRELGLNSNILTNELQIDQTIAKSELGKSKAGDAKLRTCNVNPGLEENGILGKVAHLALIKDPAIAHVLAWNLKSDMDCLITLNMSKAKEIYYRSNKNQQVLAIDSIYKKNLPDWNKALPHSKIHGYSPEGNPKFARHYLQFPKEPEKCRLVFGQLLGDTIILDNLETATAYREKVIQTTYCPTLLTKTGDRISSNGKFGGNQNVAPLPGQLKAIFGEPFPEIFYKLEKQISLLKELRILVEKKSGIASKLEALKKENGFANKKTEMKEAEERIKIIEVDLGVGIQNNRATPARPKKVSTPINKRKSDQPVSNGSGSKRRRTYY